MRSGAQWPDLAVLAAPCGPPRRLHLGADQPPEEPITAFVLAALPPTVGTLPALPAPIALPLPPLPPLPALPGLPALPNPVAGLAGHGLLAGGRALLRAVLDSFLSGLAAPLAHYLLHTPDLLAEPTLRRLWLVSVSCLFALAGLLAAIAGTALIPGGQTRLGQAAREALSGRFLAALLTATVTLPLVAGEVELANRVIDVLVPSGLGGAGDPVWGALSGAVRPDPGASLAVLVVAAVAVVLLVVLAVLGMARWATLWLLVVLAPFVMAFAMLPGGGAVGRLWWRLQLATVFMPLAHAVLLGSYVAMFSSARTGLVGALSGVALLALMAKVPKWAAGFAVGVDAADVTRPLRRSHRAVRRVAAALPK